MEHASSSHSYSWEIDFSSYADEWFEEGKREEYESAIRFATIPAEMLRLDSDNPNLYLKDVYNRGNNDQMAASFSSSKALTDQELVEARESFLESVEETYLPQISIAFKDSPILEKGIAYKADVEEDEPVRVETDPEWNGDIMQRALEDEFFPYDSLKEFKQR